ncbi:hypothetical protein HMPREF1869_00070 [Bacteroidales bacterium KA00251]|nr:hypothetical protein HMPREF1869_00070 [Bacteroidales bacterium KA00251]
MPKDPLTPKETVDFCNSLKEQDRPSPSSREEEQSCNKIRSLLTFATVSLGDHLCLSSLQHNVESHKSE